MNVTFEVKPHSTNSDLENYTVTTIFHWGDDDENNDENYTDTIITDNYPIGSTVLLSDNHTYTKEGIYNAGYSILFGNGSASCEGKNVTNMKLLKFEKLPDLCAWSDIPETIAPSPAVAVGSSNVDGADPTSGSISGRGSTLLLGMLAVSAATILGL